MPVQNPQQQTTFQQDKFVNRNFDQAAFNELTKFIGFYDNPYREPFLQGNSFVFITKPLLFLDYEPQTTTLGALAYSNMTKDPFFTPFILANLTNDYDKEIIKMLSYNIDKYNVSGFLPIFTNQNKSFDASDLQIGQVDAFETKEGYREPLPTNLTQAKAANTVSFTVTEDSNLSFTKLMGLWVNYISNITDGTFDANPEMINSGTIDYMSSIYYFTLGPDGRTIKYWCKYTGCWPTAIPYNNFRSSRGQNEPVEINIPFNYTVKEDMNPCILEEFNIIALKLIGQKITRNIVTSNGTSYASFTESPLLTYNGLNNLNNTNNISVSALLKSDDRDPVVLFVDNNIPVNSKNSVGVDSKEGHYELLFSDSGYKSPILGDIMGDQNYYFNDTATNFTKDGKIDFWQTETIE